MESVGFEILRQERNTCHYTVDKTSMMRTVYNAAHLVARKPLNATAPPKPADPPPLDGRLKGPDFGLG